MLFQFYDLNEGEEERGGSVLRAEAAFIRRGRRRLSALPISVASGGNRQGCEYGAARRLASRAGDEVGSGKTGGSGRADEEVSVTRQRGGEYDAPPPGRNYRTHSTFFLTHSIPILSNEGGG